MSRTQKFLWFLVGLNGLCIAINIPFFPNPINVITAGACLVAGTFATLVALD